MALGCHWRLASARSQASGFLGGFLFRILVAEWIHFALFGRILLTITLTLPTIIKSASVHFLGFRVYL